MTTKPIKLDSDGKLKQFSSNDQLPNQEQVDYELLLIRKIIFTMAQNGIDIQDIDLLNELNNIK